jgi:hypothetical protein
MTNTETILDYIKETQPTDVEFYINPVWLLKILEEVTHADSKGLLINPAWLRAKKAVVFAGQDYIPQINDPAPYIVFP